MKIAVCEDEKICSDMLSESLMLYFEKNGSIPEIKVFDDGIPLSDEVSSGERFDIIFMDLQLKDSDGMETAARIRKYDPDAALIFITGIEDRAVEGYSVSAFDYIVKSTVSERLEKVLDRYFTEKSRGMISLSLQSGETFICSVSDIIWLESSGRGTHAGMSGSVLDISVPIGKISAELPENMFTEVHKSVFAQTEKIRSIGTDTVEMSDGKVLPLSRRKRKTVMSAVMNAVKGHV